MESNQFFLWSDSANEGLGWDSQILNKNVNHVILVVTVTGILGTGGVDPKYYYSNVDVSKNRGTPKWMVYNGKPYWNG